MDYFYIENKTQESAFVCEKCKKYLVTLYRAGNLFARDMDISAISSDSYGYDHAGKRLRADDVLRLECSELTINLILN